MISKINMIIREETKYDWAQITKINNVAFGQKDEGILVEKLRTSDAFVEGLSLVAEVDDCVVGHILFTKVQIINDENSFESLALAPIAVLPDFQKQGIGSALIREGLKKATEKGFSSVVVLGHEKYCPRFGFKPASSWNIRPPFQVPENVFMALELQPGSLENVSGVVHYSTPFNDL